MECFWPYRRLKDMKLDRQVNLWVWLGRIAPLTSLLALGTILMFDVSGWVEYIVIGIAISFGVIAFTWWWWVIYAVKDLSGMLSDANVKFGKIITELKEIKEEFKKR